MNGHFSNIVLFAICCFLLTTPGVFAGPTSTNFELRNYDFGSGATEDSSSTNFSLFGIAGEGSQGSLSSGNFGVGAGLPHTIMPALPPAPTFTNPGNTYDRLHIVIATAGNPSDTTYAIAITESTDTNWNNIKYVQSDSTPGTILGIEDFQTYTAWGGASGSYITNLSENVTYKVKVKARQGNFTETGWGPESTATTDVPTLTFGVDSDAIVFNDLNSFNNYTDSSKSTVLTTSTNAYNGYLIYGFATQVLTSGVNTVPHYASPNSAPTTWTGYGFGYSTDDTNLVGGTANRFTDSGPKFAGFTGTSPGDPVADTSGPIVSTILSQDYAISYRVSANPTSLAGKYSTTLIYIVVPTF